MLFIQALLHNLNQNRRFCLTIDIILGTINLLVPAIFLSQVVVELQIFRIFNVFFNNLRLKPKNKQKQTQADQSENKAPF